MNTSKHIAYVGPFFFPYDGAASRFIEHISKSLISEGNNVSVVCSQKDNEPDLSNLDGIDIHRLDDRKAEHLPKIFKHLSYLSIGLQTIEWLEKNKPDAVILYSGYSPYLLRLHKWCSKNKVPLIFHAVEWYDPSSFLESFTPFYLNIELAMRYLSTKVDGVLVISKYLEDYYKKNNLKTFKIPPVTDTAKYEEIYESRSGLNLIYAGYPGSRKDRLDLVIKALNEINQDHYKVSLTLAGMNSKEFKKYANINGVKEIKFDLKTKGRLEHKDLIKEITIADYSIFVREIARFSKAGFPTKYVDSVACGTPVITNHTSDLADHLKNKKNGIVVQDPSIKSIKKSILEAIKIKKNQDCYYKLRKNAKHSAQNFDFRKFNHQISLFINQAINGKS